MAFLQMQGSHAPDVQTIELSRPDHRASARSTLCGFCFQPVSAIDEEKDVLLDLSGYRSALAGSLPVSQEGNLSLPRTQESSERLQRPCPEEPYLRCSDGGEEDRGHGQQAADVRDGVGAKTQTTKDEREGQAFRVSDKQEEVDGRFRERAGQSDGEARQKVHRASLLTAVETETSSHAGRLKMSAHAISLRASCRFIELDSGIWQVRDQRDLAEHACPHSGLGSTPRARHPCFSSTKAPTAARPCYFASYAQSLAICTLAQECPCSVSRPVASRPEPLKVRERWTTTREATADCYRRKTVLVLQIRLRV